MPPPLRKGFFYIFETLILVVTRKLIVRLDEASQAGLRARAPVS